MSERTTVSTSEDPRGLAAVEPGPQRGDAADGRSSDRRPEESDREFRMLIDRAWVAAE